ncbi:hypothetical protein C0992_011181 [Termitomyces sp. T32_za158]|nr:hypothetical protein C0992_011181 [Termitomyces sp. T32_za158]
MASRFGQSAQSSGKEGRPGQGPQRKQPTSDFQQYAAVPYPGCKAPLPYEMPLHVQMEVDQEEERYERQFQEVHHKRYYQPGLSRCQAPAPTYAHAVAPVMRREVVPQAHSEMGTEVLLQCLEAVEQPVPPTASFLQDNLAIMVMEGLLNQIELMRRQHISVLEQINHAAKCKLSSPEGPTAASTGQPAVGATAVHKPKVPEAPVEDISPYQQDEEMDEVPLFRKDLKFMYHFESISPSAGKKVGPYDGLMATAAVGKGKQQAVPAIKDDSNYGQLQSKEEEEAEEGESAPQRFQHVQHNKKLAQKKANKAKVVVALAHRAQNDFSGCIPDSLGVKGSGPLLLLFVPYKHCLPWS